MKIVVTGALGHIGSSVIRELPLISKGMEIVMIDNLMTQRYCSLYNLPAYGKYKFIEADILNINLKPVFEGSKVVIQLAAITDAASSFENKDKLEHNNYNTTVKVAEACSAAGCSMIHLSSTSVYGTQDDLVDENCSDSDLKPQSPYAETKLKEEKFLKNLGVSGKLRFITCRFGTIAGVSTGMRFHTAVNKFCWQAVMGQPITVWRTALHQKRPYLDLSDAIRAFDFIIKNDMFDNRIYNVLTENLTVNSIIDFIKKHIPDVSIQYVDTKIMNQLSYNVSNERVRSKGFEPKGSIERTVEETINLLKGSVSLKHKK